MVENALVPAKPDPLADAKLREERKALRRKKREGKLMDLVQGIQMGAAEDMSLRAHVFKTDEELRAAGLTAQQIAKVRKWEEPKRHTAFALEASSTIVTAMLRKENDRGKVNINVETMNFVRLPEPQEETGTPVIIEITPESK